MRDRYVWSCKATKCTRRVRTPEAAACRIIVDGVDYGVCHNLKRTQQRKEMIPVHDPLSLGQIKISLLAMQSGKTITNLDKQIIDEFLSWMEKRFHRVRIMKSRKKD